MAVLEVHGSTLSMDTPLMSVGLDSIAATELTTILAEQLDTGLPQTVLFDHPTIRSVAGFVSTSAGETASAAVDTD